jgi:hypothetical protein
MGHRYIGTVSLFLLAVSIASSAFPNDRTEDSKRVLQAKSLVQQSLQAEASGDESNRGELLMKTADLKSEMRKWRSCLNANETIQPDW